MIRFAWPITLAGMTTLVALAYWPALGVGYISDDFDVLVVRAMPWSAAFDAYPAGTGFYFRPLPLLTYRLEAALGGGAVLAHAVNVALHVLASLLVALVARRLGAGVVLAGALALWFALHTANTTPVYWISARADLLAALFVLLAAHAATGWRLYGGVLRLVVCALALAAALLSKEAAAAAPVAVLLLAAVAGGGRARGSMTGVLAAVVPVWLLWFGFAGSRAVGAAGGALSMLAPARDALRDLSQAAYGTLAPFGRFEVQALYLARPALVLAVAAGLMLVVGLAYSWILWRRRDLAMPVAVVGAVWLAAVAPVVFAGDGLLFRQLYLPTALLAASAALVVVHLRAQRPVTVVVLAASAILAIFTVQTGQLWSHNAALVRAGCDSWLQHVPDAAGDPPVLVLTAPSKVGEVAVFSNDLPATMHHCATGRFGRLRNVSVLVLPTYGRDDPRSGAVQEGGQETLRSAYTWQAPSWRSHVHLWGFPPARVSVRVEERHDYGEVSRARVELDPAVFDSHSVLDFRGAGFERLDRP